MSKRKTQQDLLIEHKPLFELIVIISNQIIRQAQLVDILMETGYCKNRTAVTRLIQKLEENKLIHRFKEEHYRYTSIQALKPAIKFIKGVDAYPVKITHGIREITNAVRVELFKKYYLEDNMTLEQATFNAIQNPTSSLFSSNKNFYHWLNKDDLAFHSFNAKSSSFFKQIAEIDSISLQEKQKFQDSVRREEGAKLRTNKFDKRCWTLKTLTDRKTYLIQADLSEPFMEIKADWLDTYYKKAKNFEPTQLNLHFAIVTLASDPNKTNLVKSMMNVIKYVKRSFKMHFNYFIEEKEIKKAITNININIDVVLLNQRALDLVDQEDYLDYLNRKLKRHQTSYNFKYTYELNFISAGVNENNEHLLIDKDEDEDKNKG